MKLVIEGIETPIEIDAGRPRVLEIRNHVLFTRVVRSLRLGKGIDAFEPYSVWSDGDEELNPASSFLVVSDPMNLPWDHRLLSGRLHEVVESLMMEDEELRIEIERMGDELRKGVARLTHQVNADYSFGVEWGIRQYLKSFAFSVDRFEDASYLDSLISFPDFCADMALRQVVVFVNLKTFLSKKELSELYERVFFLGLRVLLLETLEDTASYGHEKKTVVDLHFLES